MNSFFCTGLLACLFKGCKNGFFCTGSLLVCLRSARIHPFVLVCVFVCLRSARIHPLVVVHHEAVELLFPVHNIFRAPLIELDFPLYLHLRHVR